LACGAPVVALGRGGAAETVDDRMGRLYSDATPQGLLAALDAWEAAGRPHDPAVARRRAEALATPLFRDRLLGYLAEVVAGFEGDRIPPAPHVPLAPRGLSVVSERESL
jgi:hypothetical protein